MLITVRRRLIGIGDRLIDIRRGLVNVRRRQSRVLIARFGLLVSITRRLRPQLAGDHARVRALQALGARGLINRGLLASGAIRVLAISGDLLSV